MAVKISGLDAVKSRLERVERRCREITRSMDGRSVSVSIPASAKYPNGTPVRRVAALVEYGTARMEPRPFMRIVRAENKSKWQSMLRSGARRVAKGNATVTGVLRQVGETMKQDVQDAVMEVGAVDTGRLRDSFQVVIH